MKDDQAIAARGVVLPRRQASACASADATRPSAASRRSRNTIAAGSAYSAETMTKATPAAKDMPDAAATILRQTSATIWRRRVLDDRPMPFWEPARRCTAIPSRHEVTAPPVRRRRGDGAENIAAGAYCIIEDDDARDARSRRKASARQMPFRFPKSSGAMMAARHLFLAATDDAMMLLQVIGQTRD